jgi:rod shape-determining protein MreC
VGRGAPTGLVEMPLTRQRTIPLLFVMCLGHVLLISAQVQSRQGVPLIEDAAFGTFARIQHATAAVSDAGRSIWTQYFALSGAARDNEDLRRRIVELEANLQMERARSGQVRALEDILEMRRSMPLRSVSARVIAGSPAPGSLTVLIDRGLDDGVESDMAVIAVPGIVGRVLRATATAATVQLLVSGNAAAGAQLEGSGSGGVVMGVSGNPPLSLNYVLNQVPVQVGERVVTSGLEVIYPPGLAIGAVARAGRGADLYQEILVTPAVDFTNIGIVLVVLDRPVSGEVRRP